jgi:hypothetical protein
VEQKDLKNIQSGHKRSELKEGMCVEEINFIKKKPSTLHRDNRKDALRASQELARSHKWQTPGYEIVNS